MRAAILVVVALTLAGCSGQMAQSPPSLAVKGDTYCELAEKQSWSVRDTAETITSARRANAKYDRICAEPKPTS